MSKKYYKDVNNSNIIECDENLIIESNECVEITKAQYDALKEIQAAKAILRDTDYVVIKIAEAETEEEKAALRTEYAEVISRRRGARAIINELEGE